MGLKQEFSQRDSECVERGHRESRDYSEDLIDKVVGCPLWHLSI